MTVMTSRVDRINLQAKRYRRTDPAKALVSAIAFVPFLIGWTARKTALVVWATISWIWAAIVVGWQSASGETRRN